MHADGILDRERFAPTGCQVGIEIVDEPQAVAPEFKAIGAHAHTVFADIEGILAKLRCRRIAIGNDHFC